MDNRFQRFRYMTDRRTKARNVMRGARCEGVDMSTDGPMEGPPAHTPALPLSSPTGVIARTLYRVQE
jgi:hypothetical protein